MEKICYLNSDEYIYYEKLINGLEVYMYPKKNARNFYLTLNVKFGALNTEFKQENTKNFLKVPVGTAHFLEHKMFDEGDGHTAFEYFAKLGSSVNAFTTYNYTCYEVTSSDHFKENLNYLLDYVSHPVFNEKNVSSEKGIIYEEIKMYDNTPGARLTFGLEYNLNINDNHKFLISGTKENVEKIKCEDLNKIYDSFYNPGNMFLVLTGNFEPLEALGIIKENQNNKEYKLSKKVITKLSKEPDKVFKRYEEVEMDVSIPKIKIAYKMNRRLFKEYDDLTLRIYLDAILKAKFSKSSLFNYKLVSNNLIINDLITSREVRKDYIVIYFEMESEYIDEVRELLKEELLNLKITNEELTRVKNVNTSDFIINFNDIIMTNEDIQDDIINYGKISTNILELYKNLDLNVINSIKDKFNYENSSTFVIKKINS